MRRLSDSAERAKCILERESAPLSAECERIVARDLERTLSGYFDLTGKLSLQIERGDKIVIIVRAKAVQVKPFGLIK